ncbi:hypothetical protein MRX96_000512 [Rhipicephalus microplus]
MSAYAALYQNRVMAAPRPQRGRGTGAARAIRVVHRIGAAYGKRLKAFCGHGPPALPHHGPYNYCSTYTSPAPDPSRLVAAVPHALLAQSFSLEYRERIRRAVQCAVALICR